MRRVARWMIVVMLTAGCGAPPSRQRATTSPPEHRPVDVRADTTAQVTLARGPVRVTLERVTLAHPERRRERGTPEAHETPAAAESLRGVISPTTPPERSRSPAPAARETTATAIAPAASGGAPGNAVLEPPVLLHLGGFLPIRGRPVEPVVLDVLVDTQGRVVETQWAGGSRDPGLVVAAQRVAERMIFKPARLAGRPVEAWCRQRFEFGAR